MQCRSDERGSVEAASRERGASCTRRRSRVGSGALLIICAVVCSLAVLALPGTSGAAGGRTKIWILGQRAEFDRRLQTSLIDQPRWLRGDQRAHDGGSGSLGLFLATQFRQAPATDGTEARRAPTALSVRELSFPVRKVAAERLLTRTVALKLSVGLDRELESSGMGQGEVTPSVGLQFERRFQ